MSSYTLPGRLALNLLALGLLFALRWYLAIGVPGIGHEVREVIQSSMFAVMHLATGVPGMGQGVLGSFAEPLAQVARLAALLRLRYPC